MSAVLPSDRSPLFIVLTAGVSLFHVKHLRSEWSGQHKVVSMAPTRSRDTGLILWKHDDGDAVLVGPLSYRDWLGVGG